MLTELTDTRYDKFFYKSYKYLLGSASSALYVYLKYKKLTEQEILVPSNICHSIPLTIVYSKNNPIFYDIEINTGNPNTQSILNILKNQKIAAIILPNMYGNLYTDRKEIIKVLKDKNILVIDDCAASLGADMDDLKENGDAAIFSFGKNKHLDLGAGGLLATNEVIDIKQQTKNIKNTYEDSLYKIELFDKIYKPIFYSKFYYQLLPLIDKTVDFFQDSYVFQFIWSVNLIEKLNNQLNLLEHTKNISLEKVEYLNNRINFDNMLYTKYEFHYGSNPWRYNILINDLSTKEKIISESIMANLQISKWYAPIEKLFGQPTFQNSVEFSDRILNFNHMHSSYDDINKFIDILNKLGGRIEK
ncbi:MAG: DegT/DnrJ/EryC1/StrS family aminotransferase [Arcobacteraceae bacterium]